jgi:6-phosphogluconolactonase
MTQVLEVRIFPNPAELFVAAAQQFAKLANDAIGAKGSFTVALSGGSTPKGMHSLLASEFVSAIDWDRVFFFWGDERHVPPDHADSNYRMAYETLLSRVPADPRKIFRVPAENPDANAAANEYEQTLSTAFRLEGRQAPRFDLILLGLGPDGHTASLFPHTSALRENSRLVVANRVEKLDTDRITLTLPVLNNAANIVFLVAGKDKAPAVESVFNSDSDASEFPAKLVRPRHGQLLWMLTEDAGSAIADRMVATRLTNNQH